MAAACCTSTSRGSASGPLQPAAQDDRDVRRQVGRGEGVRPVSGPLALEGAEGDVPRGAARRKEAALRRDVDEALDAQPQPFRQELRKGDLVAAREDHLAAADDACLE
jgi:hypothetical protein